MPSLMEIVTESLHFDKFFPSIAKEYMHLQQYQKEQKRLQEIETSLRRTIEFASSFQKLNKQMHKVVTSVSAVDQVTSALINPGPFPAIASSSVVDGLIPSSLESPLSLVPWHPTAERRKAVRRRMCAATLLAFPNDPELVTWFIAEALGLPLSYSCIGMVWQALLDGGWQSVDWPLNHVRQFVVRLHAQDAQENGNLLSTTGSNDEEQSRLTLQEHDGHGQLARPLTMHARGRRGRPPGSGIYATANDLLNTVVPIIQKLRQEGRRPSQANVADLLPNKPDVRQLRKWVKTLLKMYWQEVLERW